MRLTYKNFFSFHPFKLKPELSLSLTVRVRLYMFFFSFENKDFSLKNSYFSMGQMGQNGWRISFEITVFEKKSLFSNLLKLILSLTLTIRLRDSSGFSLKD